MHLDQLGREAEQSAAGEIYPSDDHVSGAAAEPFRVEITSAATSIRVKPIGELDLATVGELDSRFDGLVASGCGRIVLDLRGLTFMGSCGLQVVLIWLRRAGEIGVEFRLIQGPPIVRRVFELAGLDSRMPFVPAGG